MFSTSLFTNSFTSLDGLLVLSLAHALTLARSHVQPPSREHGPLLARPLTRSLERFLAPSLERLLAISLARLLCRSLASSPDRYFDRSITTLGESVALSHAYMLAIAPSPGRSIYIYAHRSLTVSLALSVARSTRITCSNRHFLNRTFAPSLVRSLAQSLARSLSQSLLLVLA